MRLSELLCNCQFQNGPRIPGKRVELCPREQEEPEQGRAEGDDAGRREGAQHPGGEQGVHGAHRRAQHALPGEIACLP